MTKTRLVIAACAIGIGLVVWFGVAGEDPREPAVEEATTPLALGAIGRVEEFTYTRTVGGRTEWEIHSHSAELFQERNLAIFENCNLRFFMEDGRELGLIGRRGTLHTDTMDVEIEGSIVASSQDGFRLLTNSLSYDAEARVLSTDDPVLFFGDRITVRGLGLRIDVETEEVTLGGPVQAQLWDLGPAGGDGAGSRVRL